MPQALIPVVGALAAGVTVSAAGAITFSVTAALTAFASSLVLSGLSRAFEPDAPSFSGGSNSFSAVKSGNSTQSIRQSITEHRIIYGQTRVGGAITFAGTSEDNKYLHLIVTLAAHELEAIDEVWINDTPIPLDYIDGSNEVIDGFYDGLIRIKKHLGSTSQTADTDLVTDVPEWTTDHRGRGRAYIYCKFEFDRDKFSKIPNISAYVRGKKVLDTRDDVTRFTTNAGLLSRDFLSSEQYGVAALTADIDDDFTDSAANECDEIVTTEDIDASVTSIDAATDIITVSVTEDVLPYQLGDRISFITTGTAPIGINLTVENLALYSEEFDDSIWTKARISVTADATEAPDNDETTTADQIIENTDTNTHYVRQKVTGRDMTVSHTFSCYVKANGRDKVRLQIQDDSATGNDCRSNFDLSLGTVLSETNQGSGVHGGSTIENVGNDWFRISVSGIPNTGGGTNDLRILLYCQDSGGNITYTGDGASGIYAWGGQLEVNASLGQYVKTTSSAVSEPKDYYIIPYQFKDDPRLQLADSLANALSYTAVDMTDSGSGSHTIRKTGEPRYTAGGILNTKSNIDDNLKDVLSAMGGQAIYAGGQWRLKASKYEAPTVTFSEDDFIAPMKFFTKTSLKDRFNRVKGVYVSPINLSQPSDYPAVKNATYETQDGELIIKDYDLAMTQRPHTAQRLAKIELEKSRQEIIVELTCNLRALQVQAGDNIYLDKENLGWSAKEFEVIQWNFTATAGGENEDPQLGISMIVRETASAVYSWNSGEETTVDPAPNTSLPDPYTVTVVTGFTLSSYIVNTKELDRVYSVLASWDLHTNQFVISGGKYEIEYKETTESVYKSAGKVDGTVTEMILPALRPDVLYDIRIFAYNSLDVRSAETLLEDFQVGQTVTTNTEDWENESNARDNDDWETDTLSDEDWEAI